MSEQPLQIGLVNQPRQQAFPDALVPPAAKPPVRILSILVIRRQIPPRTSSAQHPEYRVDKTPVVLGPSSPDPLPPRQMSLKEFPMPLADVMPMIRRGLRRPCHARLLPLSISRDDTI